MSATERFVVFACEGDACIGVLSLPESLQSAKQAGVVIVVGGPQYRAGSHRQFVSLARALAGSGYPTLRFDYRGMGDSEGDPRTFEAVDSDLAAAVGALQRATQVRRVVLWGLCDGATAALMYAASDPRIAGTVAVNPWAQSPAGTASTRLRHYYLRRLSSIEFWRKALRGHVDLRNSGSDLADLLRSDSRAPPVSAATAYLRRLEDGWSRFSGPVLFIVSGNDLTAREFERWVDRDRRRSRLFRSSRTAIHRIPEADHTFSSRSWCLAASRETIEWLQRSI